MKIEIEIKIVPSRDPYEHIRQMLDEADKNGTHEQVWLCGWEAFCIACARCANINSSLCRECRCEIQSHYKGKAVTE